jgi:hypothetical protein
MKFSEVALDKRQKPAKTLCWGGPDPMKSEAKAA